jgi:hypothetical protein
MMSSFADAEALHASLTTPDSEDWTVVVDGATVHVAAYRETRNGDGKPVVWTRGGEGRLADFKHLVEHLPKDHDLGCVSVILPRDADARGGATMLRWLHKKSRRSQKFNVIAIAGPATTREAAEVLQSYYLESAK